jgi:hypothetical protein
LLCRVLGRDEEEERYLRAAVAFDDRTGQVPAAARSRVELARTLRRRGGAVAVAAAAELVDQARALAEPAGLLTVTALCEELAAP